MAGTTRPRCSPEGDDVKKTELFSALAGEMKNLGFKRRRSNYEYVLDLGDGFEGWCSFDDDPKGEKNVLWVSLFAGVRCAEVEDRIQAWCGEVVPGWDGKFYVATTSMNLGYTLTPPAWLEHRIDLSGDQADEAVEPVVSDVAGPGLRFLRDSASYAGLTAAFELGQGQLADRVLERLPLTLALQGRTRQAHEALDRMRLRIDEGSYLAPRYLRFISGFEDEFPR